MEARYRNSFPHPHPMRYLTHLLSLACVAGACAFWAVEGRNIAR